jgi:hypothetical protein
MPCLIYSGFNRNSFIIIVLKSQPSSRSMHDDHGPLPSKRQLSRGNLIHFVCFSFLYNPLLDQTPMHVEFVCKLEKQSKSVCKFEVQSGNQTLATGAASCSSLQF